MWPSPLEPGAVALLLLVTAQRLIELVIARRNDARLRAAGGVEYGAGHYPFMLALHAAWLIGLWAMATRIAPSLAWVAGYLVLQGLRLWTLCSLGRRWTTRVIVVPGAPLVRRGPYRFMRHPNYAIVAAEIFVLPMAFGLTVYAIVFSVLNALVLAIRLLVEERALSTAPPEPLQPPS